MYQLYVTPIKHLNGEKKRVVEREKKRVGETVSEIGMGLGAGKAFRVSGACDCEAVLVCVHVYVVVGCMCVCAYYSVLLSIYLMQQRVVDSCLASQGPCDTFCSVPRLVGRGPHKPIAALLPSQHGAWLCLLSHPFHIPVQSYHRNRLTLPPLQTIPAL